MRFLLFSLLALAPLTSARADWLNFRGPAGSGYALGLEQPPAELGETTLAWKVSLPGRGLGSPVLVGDRVYLTAAAGPDQERLHVLCFDAADGAPVWERRLWATGRTMTHEKTCVAASTPASDGERLYCLFSSGDLVCLDLAGDVRWMRGLTLDYPNASNSLGMASSPIVAGDTLVAQIENDSESFAAGFDPLTGRNAWKIERPASANWTSPTLLDLDGQSVVALQSGRGVLGVLPDTGSAVFEFDGGASTIPSSAAVDDRLYIPSHGLTALRVAADGGGFEELWNESAQRPGTASPLVLDDRVYVINKAGVLNCADAATGERLWRIRLEGPISGSPVAAGPGRLYVFNERGIGQVVDLTGEKGRVADTVELGETILGTPSLDDGALYLRSDGHLWKFAAE